jgi:hypothetical protein
VNAPVKWEILGFQSFSSQKSASDDIRCDVKRVLGDLSDRITDNLEATDHHAGTGSIALEKLPYYPFGYVLG